jgi:hypothetical protein
MVTPYLYRGERAPQQQCYPDEAFAAMFSEPYLPRIPSTIAPRPNTMLPKPHDLKIIARIGPPISRMAAANRRIPVRGAFLVAISLSA